MAFNGRDLMQHVRYLADEIGPRPTASTEELAAAGYVQRILAQHEIRDVRVQPFETTRSAGTRTLPYLTIGALAVPLGWVFGAWGKFTGGLLAALSAVGLREAFRSRPAPWRRLTERGSSQNVIAHVPAAEQAEKHLVLVAHLDTQKVRLSFPREPIAANKPFNTGGLLLLGLGGLGLMGEGLSDDRRFRLWHLLLAGVAGYSLYEAVRDEANPHVDGANDNASAVAVLLGIAEKLAAEPLPQTEVTLLFTGAAEAGCVGIEQFLTAEELDRQRTLFIDLEMVGTGDICYVTEHGISHLSTYVPGPKMTSLAAQTAREHPELKVTGQPMLILEEVSVLADHGYDAVCVAGHDRQGKLPNWHRPEDATANIQPKTLARAADYVWALMQAVDAKDYYR